MELGSASLAASNTSLCQASKPTYSLSFLPICFGFVFCCLFFVAEYVFIIYLVFQHRDSLHSLAVLELML